MGGADPLGYSAPMSVAALVLAAGRGERLAADLPKAFVPLAGTPLLVHSILAMAQVPEVRWIVPVLAESDHGPYAALAEQLREISGLLEPVTGGLERQDSMRAGLAALPEEVKWVAVHDAARPLVLPSDVSKAIAVAQENGAALLVSPVRDTVKRVVGGKVVETPVRAELYAAQTPQVFRRDWLVEAVEKAAVENFLGTDDAQLVEKMGKDVWIVEGSPDNIKITLPEDLLFGEAILRRRAARRSEPR